MRNRELELIMKMMNRIDPNFMPELSHKEEETFNVEEMLDNLKKEFGENVKIYDIKDGNITERKNEKPSDKELIAKLNNKLACEENETEVERDWDLDTEECRQVQDEDRYNLNVKDNSKLKEVLDKFKCELNDYANNNNLKGFKQDYDNITNEQRVRHDEMFISDFQIDFEAQDLPCRDEVVFARMYFDKVDGKQYLTLTIKPLGHDTYLGKFNASEKLGRIFLVNKTIGLQHDYENILLSENAISHGIFCNNLIGRNDKHVVDLCTPFEYEVTIEL